MDGQENLQRKTNKEGLRIKSQGLLSSLHPKRMMRIIVTTASDQGETIMVIMIVIVIFRGFNEGRV